MNSNTSFDDYDIASNSSEDGAASNSSSTSSSRAERLRRERTQRHRQRIRGQASGKQKQSSQQQSQGGEERSAAVNDAGSASDMQQQQQRGQQPKKKQSTQNKSSAARQQQVGAPSQRSSNSSGGGGDKYTHNPNPPPRNPAAQSSSSRQQHASSSSQTSSQQQQQQQPPVPPPLSTAPPPPPTSSTSHSKTSGPVLVSVESPLPPLVQRSLGDRSYDKRKNAALEIEQLVKSLNEAHNVPMISSIISVLAKDFCTSMNANYRKGGLIGIAATAIGLMGNTRAHLEGLLFPVLHCFDDPESRVRYYACESLYNIAKVARGGVLRYFNQIFDGLTKLFADVDVDVKNGATLLDRLVKDIVTESETFHVEHFLPLLTTYIRRTNPYIRQLLVGWITVLDTVPDISMIDYLPDFLDGLFNMLSDSNREIRQAADSALSDFLREVRHATVIEFGPLVSILVDQCLSKDRLNRLTAITWIEELIHHPYSGGDALLPHHAEVLGAILYCMSDSEEQICMVSERTNSDLLTLVRDTRGDFQLAPLFETITEKFISKDDVPTKMASLRWINMLLEKRRGDMTQFVPQLLPVLLKTLSDESDSVVLFTLQVLARISLGDGGVHLDDNGVAVESRDSPGESSESKEKEQKNVNYGILLGEKDEKHFKLVINAVLGLFASDRMLLEKRGSLVVRKLCVLLDSESVYMLMADVLSSSCDETAEKGPNTTWDHDMDSLPVKFSAEYVSTMVHTLNLILLTANELHGLRVLLSDAFVPSGGDNEHSSTQQNSVRVFESLFRCWCHSPVATFSLCLLSRAYDVAFSLVQRFSQLEVTVGFLMQIDKLVQLIESPVFVHLRLQLLDVESPHHAPLLKSCYGLLMLLPQSDAFRSLNDRLAAVCNLRDNLGLPPTTTSLRDSSMGNLSKQNHLLTHFDEITKLHRDTQLASGDVLNDPMGRKRFATSASAVTKGPGRLISGGAAGTRQEV